MAVQSSLVTFKIAACLLTYLTHHHKSQSTQKRIAENEETSLNCREKLLLLLSKHTSLALSLAPPPMHVISFPYPLLLAVK
jgi:hypothetical protein